MRTVYLKKTTVDEVKNNWGFEPPNVFTYGNIYVKSNANGGVNWDKNPIYTEEELKGRKIKILENLEKSTDKYIHCNHHHVIADEHQEVDFGDGVFVANNEAVSLLKALSEVGLRTRTHHIGKEKSCFLSIILDNVTIEIKDVFEKDSTRTKYNGKKELLLIWIKQ